MAKKIILAFQDGKIMKSASQLPGKLDTYSWSLSTAEGLSGYMTLIFEDEVDLDYTEEDFVPEKETVIEAPVDYDGEYDSSIPFLSETPKLDIPEDAPIIL